MAVVSAEKSDALSMLALVRGSHDQAVRMVGGRCLVGTARDRLFWGGAGNASYGWNESGC